MNKKEGSITEFDQNWQTRREAKYNHWVRGSIKNQIQFAFKNHYKVFSEFLKVDGILNGHCLEVGCGRGSISSFFADDGYSCTLLDYSVTVLQTADEIFSVNGHQATFVHGDANKLPFLDDAFDVVVSIGLLEHFEEIKKPISEQVRVLKSGGRFFGYIVPERPNNIQKYFFLVNIVLKKVANIFSVNKKSVEKQPIYRSDFGSSHYLDSIKDLPLRDVQVFGMYPMPMISHSPEFPFSLLPAPLEWILTKIFGLIMRIRRLIFRRNPWICTEELGQAFLITFRKL
jgi:ubiquinone/menaquinone biosynthesis C-methylase UbiE